MDLDQIKALVQFMRSEGVDVFKVDTLEVKFSPNPGPATLEPTAEEKRKALLELLKSENDDQEADLLWSST